MTRAPASPLPPLPAYQDSRRINVIGNSGSGKSTFSRRLAEALQIPYVEMDALFWEPHWKEAENEVFFERLTNVVDDDAWVLDGNYTRTIPLKWPRAQTVLWLDYPLPLVAWRSIRRAASRAATKQELWAGTGNTESFRKSFFSKDSIVLYALTRYRLTRQRYELLFANGEYPQIEMIRFRSPRAAASYLEARATAPVANA